MKRKKREAFIMAAVAGSFVVSMTGPQDIWALGNNGGRSYKVQTIQDSSTGKTAARGYVDRLYSKWGCDMVWKVAECFCSGTGLSDCNECGSEHDIWLLFTSVL